MNQIKDRAGQYDFGLDFNYAVWVPGTQVSLVNVPWNNDYRDVVRFDSRAKLNEYINSKQNAGITIDQLSYTKPNQPIRINIPFNRVNQYNYLRASNPIQPVPGNDVTKDYYYFITGIEYISPNTTELTLQLDVWQTYVYDVEIGNCYVERGHIGIANENQFDAYGRNYLTTPEGFDTGNEYVRRKQLFKSGIDNNDPVIAVSTVDLTASGGSVDNPNMLTGPGSYIDGIPTGATYYAWANAGYFHDWMSDHANTPWVTQGILSIMIVPRFEEFYDVFLPSSTEPTRLTNINTNTDIVSGFGTQGVNWRETNLMNYLGERYAHLRKFWTFPYLVIELTTFSGNPIVIKPECWYSEDADIVEEMSILLPNAKHSIRPRNYNASTNDGVNDAGEELDFATGFQEFVKTAVVNNGALLYLSANSNSIQFSQQSADWTQQRALGSSQAAYDVASRNANLIGDLANIGIQADISQVGISNRAQTVQTGISAGQNIAGGFVNGAPMGPGGAAIGMLGGAINASAAAAQTAVQIGANNESLSVRNATARSSSGAQMNTSNANRDTNKGLADWAARGDYATAIAGINARVQDAHMIQPSVAGQAGGAQFNLATDNWNIILRFKSIDRARINMIGDYWLRYGYAIQRFIKPPKNLMVMEKFTYWKMSETYIVSAPMPEAFKQTIRGILEKGVTIFSKPEYIGTIDIADNKALAGISY